MLKEKVGEFREIVERVTQENCILRKKIEVEKGFAEG